MLDNNLPLVLTLWLLVVGLMAFARRRRQTAGVGLVMAFLLNLWMIHWVASAVYLLPWYQGSERVLTVLGTEQSFYAVLGFAFGSLVLTPVVMNSGILPRARGVQVADSRLPGAYLLLGGIFYVLLSTSFGTLPTMTAVVSAGQELAVVGLSLCCWQAWGNRDFPKMALWLGLSCLPPLLTIVTRGFIGYGAMASLSVLIFLSNFVRSRARVAVAAVLLGYFGLSVYVNYMRDRNAIRVTVWGDQSLGNRLDRLEQTASTFEWFDLWKQEHLARIDDRLNQSYLVGAAVQRLQRTGDFAHGETLWDAVLSIIPRAVWPDKPISAGSGDLVTRFTGITFAGGTSVGIGQVMEFYANFGTAGVLIGFAVMGVLVTALDILATERLAYGDLHGFVLFYLPGLSFLQVGGQLVEVTASAAGAIIVAVFANKYLERLQRKHGEPELFERAEPAASGWLPSR